jgi:NADPH-dependent ferric siderophore reductase
MSAPDNGPDLSRIRREPPSFRAVSLRRVESMTPRLRRLTLTGAELEGFVVDEPAASVRLLLPSPGSTELVMPTWNGNEFLLADGRRPVIRTFTPMRIDPDARELELWAVVHGDGPASEWAASAPPGAPAAISGPGRGYTFDPGATAFLLAGDETAIPAISQLLPLLPSGATVAVVIEVAAPDARLELPSHPRSTVTWVDLPAGAPPGDALVAAVVASYIDAATVVWAAGEAAAVQRIRRNLFEDRGFPRTRTTVRGYWKHGRRGAGD